MRRLLHVPSAHVAFVRRHWTFINFILPAYITEITTAQIFLYNFINFVIYIIVQIQLFAIMLIIRVLRFYRYRHNEIGIFDLSDLTEL